MRYAPLIAVAALMAACTTVPTGVTTPAGPGEVPTGALELGDWRSASEASTLTAFPQSVNSRYGQGLAISSASADLRRADFSCGAAPPLSEGRGDPPAQVCRHTETASGCTHTWQVHLFDEGGGRLGRTRGLYDRRCGGEGLLGGPG